jgi:hypothetical protein
MVQRTAPGIELIPAIGIKNIFVNDWKPAFFSDDRKRIAAISFLRNIVEYTRGENDTDYEALTALLHWKSKTESITHAELDAIYRRTFSGGGDWSSPTSRVIDTIRSAAAACLSAPEGTNFENKIVLAIAIRLEAERHMCARIGDVSFIASITSNQTARLLKRYKTTAGVALAALEVLDQVALMTPENIHLNSFMYEPIIDMADDHLRALHGKVADLA